MKYITKKPVRNRTSLLVYKNFFFMCYVLNALFLKVPLGLQLAY